jgi:hypothetical protein
MAFLTQALDSLGIHRRFAVDVLSVAQGVRRIGLLHAPLPSEPTLRRVLIGAGLIVFAQRELVRQDDPDSREGVLRDPFAGEPANFIELWYARSGEAALPASATLFANPGEQLGYPPCCVAAWERLKSQRDLYQRYIFETTSGYWEVNRLAALFQPGLLIPDFFPCSLSCESARAFATPIVNLARDALDPAWLSDTIAWMQAPLLECRGVLYAFPTWDLIGQDLELSTADGARLSLAAVGRFDDAVHSGCRLISFRHLEGAERVTLVGPSGIRSSIVLDGR